MGLRKGRGCRRAELLGRAEPAEGASLGRGGGETLWQVPGTEQCGRDTGQRAVRGLARVGLGIGGKGRLESAGKDRSIL